jgi:hypothetical protein
MGWLEDAITWFVQVILRPVIQWITDAINWVIDELRYWKHEFTKLMAKWLQNDYFFLAAVAVAIAGAIFLPPLFSWIAATTFGKFIKNVVETIKKGVARVLDWVHILDLQLINSMLQAIWPEYKDLTAQFSNAISALSEELGQGSGWLHAYFEFARVMAYNINAFIGADAEAGEIRAYEDTAAFFERIDVRFKKYAHDPGLIMTDLIEEVYIPYATEMRDTQQDVLDSIRNNYDRVIRVEKLLTSTEQAVDSFIAAMPTEIQEQVNLRWEPIKAGLDSALDVLNTYVIPTVDGILNQIEQNTTAQKAINDRLMAEYADPYNMLIQAELPLYEARKDMYQYLQHCTMQGMEPEILALNRAITGSNEEWQRAVNEAVKNYPSPPVLTYESAGVAVLPTGPASDKTDWFVGEY